MKKLLYYSGLIFIAIWLFTIHTKFTYELVPKSEVFQFASIDLQKYIPYVWGLAFAMVTTIIIALLPKGDKLYWWFVFAIAFLEIVGVFVYNNSAIDKKHWTIFSSVYYGIYSGYIIIVYAYISNVKDSKDEIISDDALRMIKQEISEEEKQNTIPDKLQESCNNAVESIKNIGKSISYDKSDIERLIAEGKSDEYISELTGVHKTTVYRRRKKINENENS